MRWNSLLRVLVLGLACLFSATAARAVVVIAAGERVVFNFLITDPLLLPYRAVDVYPQWDGTVEADEVWLQVFYGLDGTGGEAAACNNACSFGGFTQASMLDGAFSLAIENTGSAAFSIGPYAWIHPVGADESVRVEGEPMEVSLVPEPGALALLGLGLAGLAASRRRPATSPAPAAASTR